MTLSEPRWGVGRRKYSPIPEEAIAAIRAGTVKTDAVYARRYKVHPASIKAIRLGRRRNPAAGY